MTQLSNCYRVGIIPSKNIYLYDRGRSIRTWGYVSDISMMILNIIQFGKSFIYNVSGSDHKSIIEIAKIISKIFKNKKILFKKKKFKLHKLKIYNSKNLIEKI